MKKSKNLIRISLFSILLLMFAGHIIVKYVDDLKNRYIFFIILLLAIFILTVILVKKSKHVFSRVVILDVLNIVIFIGLMGIFGKELLETNRIQNAFEGNNGYLFSYSKSIGDKGYEDIESALEDKIEFRQKTTNQNELEEIWRIEIEDKIFIYFKEPESIIEFEFYRQNDLYYSLGSKLLMYEGIGSSDRYTIEETIRKDIANTMWRGIGNNEVGVPAWGVCCDDSIFSITLNSKKVDEIILIDKKDGKKYYFWIMTNIGEIETIDDVKHIIIEMNELENMAA